MRFYVSENLGFFDIMFIKNMFQSPNFPKFDQTNFGSGFIYNFRQNFYCCLGQIRDLSIPNKKWRKYWLSDQIFARNTEIFQ